VNFSIRRGTRAHWKRLRLSLVGALAIASILLAASAPAKPPQEPGERSGKTEAAVPTPSPPPAPSLPQLPEHVPEHAGGRAAAPSPPPASAPKPSLPRPPRPTAPEAPAAAPDAPAAAPQRSDLPGPGAPAGTGTARPSPSLNAPGRTKDQVEATESGAGATEGRPQASATLPPASRPPGSSVQAQAPRPRNRSDAASSGVGVASLDVVSAVPLRRLLAYVWPAVALTPVQGMLDALGAQLDAAGVSRSAWPDDLLRLFSQPAADGAFEADRRAGDAGVTPPDRSRPGDGALIPLPTGAQISLLALVASCLALTVLLAFTVKRELVTMRRWPH
jgi:hypothetical protein